MARTVELGAARRLAEEGVRAARKDAHVRAAHDGLRLARGGASAFSFSTSPCPSADRPWHVLQLEPNFKALEVKIGKATTVDQLLMDHVEFLDRCLREAALTKTELIEVRPLPSLPNL